MTPAVAEILEAAEQLTTAERAELADQLFENLAAHPSPEILAAQLAEVRKRIAQVEAGEVALIPGEEAFARVRQLVSSQRTEN